MSGRKVWCGTSRSRDYMYLHERLPRTQTSDGLDLEAESDETQKQERNSCELPVESIEGCSCKKCALREEVRNGDVN